MENQYARRNFLKNVALATSGVAFLSSTSVLQAFNNGDCPFEGYNPYSETKTDLRESAFFGNHLTIKGKILNADLRPATAAMVEVWHLSPNSNRYRHQAKLALDKDGNYSFLTDFPNKEKGKYAKVYFKITEGNKVTYTELSLTADNAYINHRHFAQNQALGDQMFPTHKTVNGEQVVTFNTVI